MRRRRLVSIAAIGLLGATLAPAMSAGALTNVYSVTSKVPVALSAALPLLRLHFSGALRASSLPDLRTSPSLATAWQQIGPRSVQAVITGELKPSIVYTIALPTEVTCATHCTFSQVQPRQASMATTLTWEAQLLAQLDYLPVAFTPFTPVSDPSQATNGRFTWKYANLPSSLASQWSVGTSNTILSGALMRFQDVNQLPTTGVADAATWTALLGAAQNGLSNPGSYNYVTVTEANPESLTLYVGGNVKFRTLVNTGISVSPTATGTYPVYLRYTSQTMSGTNPNGSHYSDPGIPWISYFNGGDALHGFIRASYGWSQSLGCVEMPFTSAKVVWPYTPIGTLVTVTS